MTWSLQRRDDEWCVVNDADDSVSGSHSSRIDAIKHQRALYSSEARVASMYAELDAQPDPEPEPVVPQTSPVMAEILGMLLREQQEKSLVASVAEQQSLLSQQFQEAQQERQALVAALGRMGSPTINLPPAEVNVHVPQTQVDVHVPAAEVTVNTPDVNVEVASPNVTVRPEIVLPSSQKTVTFERDPLTQQVTKAEVTEN